MSMHWSGPRRTLTALAAFVVAFASGWVLQDRFDRMARPRTAG